MSYSDCQHPKAYVIPASSSTPFPGSQAGSFIHLRCPDCLVIVIRPANELGSDGAADQASDPGQSPSG